MTKFYLPSSGEAEVIALPSSIWNTGSYDIKALKLNKNTFTAFTKKVFVSNNSSTNTLNRVYVSPILTGDVIFTGTIKGQLNCWEAQSGDNFLPAIRIKTTDTFGIQQKNIYTFIPTGGTNHEFISNTNQSGQNRFMPLTGTVNANITGFSGYRIAIEIGAFRANSTTSSGYQVFGTSSFSPDLPENETSQDFGDNPWIEFSQLLPF